MSARVGEVLAQLVVGDVIFAAGAVICGALFRSGPLRASGPTPAPAARVARVLES